MREGAERGRGCSTSTAYSVSLAYASLSSWQGRGKLGSSSISDSSPDSIKPSSKRREAASFAEYLAIMCAHAAAAKEMFTR